MASLEEDGSLAETLDGRCVVRDEHDRPALLLEREDPAEALPLERLVTHGEDLVEQQDVRVEERGDRESQPHGHPRRVRAHGPVDRVLELGECDDLVEAGLDVGAAKSLDRTVQEHVLTAREVEVEARAELEQGADPALATDASGRRLDDPGDDAKERRLARAVAADQADRLASADLGRDVVEGPHVGRVALAALDDEILERARLARVDAKAARDALDGDLANLHAA